jgi:hypothetical protein
MTITFQKRQKEMKRQEKQREKAERRAQKKLAKRAEKGAASVNGSADAAISVVHHSARQPRPRGSVHAGKLPRPTSLGTEPSGPSLP